jgi:hypothetical protein
MTDTFKLLPHRTFTSEEAERFAAELQKICDTFSTFHAALVLAGGATRGKKVSWAKRQVRRAGGIRHEIIIC